MSALLLLLQLGFDGDAERRERWSGRSLALSLVSPGEP